MNQFIGSLVLFFVPLSIAIAQETPVGSSTITFGVGGAKPLASFDGGGPTFNGTYEYRLRTHWSLELGIDTAIVNAPSTSFGFLDPVATCPPTDFCSSYVYNYSLSPARLTVMPFGPRYVLPVHNGLAELIVGAGLSHVWAPPTFGEGSSFWGAQANLGARVAVDKQRHFWLGGTARYTHDLGNSPNQWTSFTADISYRFK